MRYGLVFGASASLFALAACSGSKSSETGQVVATVDGTELTATQFESRMKQLPPSVDPRDPAIQKATLESMIDQTVLVQAALAASIDKRPSVSRQLEESRASILSSAYADDVVRTRPVAVSEVQRYYADNPQFFGQRRAYAITDLAIPVSAPQAAAILREMRSPNASFDNVVASANSLGLEAQPTSSSVSGDQLPADLARGLARLSVGQTTSYQIGGVQHMTRVDSIFERPVTYGAAAPSIEAFIGNKARADSVGREVSLLRSKSKIVYGLLGQKINSGETADKVKMRSANEAPGKAGNTSDTILRGAKGL